MNTVYLKCVDAATNRSLPEEVGFDKDSVESVTRFYLFGGMPAAKIKLKEPVSVPEFDKPVQVFYSVENFNIVCSKLGVSVEGKPGLRGTGSSGTNTNPDYEGQSLADMAPKG